MTGTKVRVVRTRRSAAEDLRVHHSIVPIRSQKHHTENQRQGEKPSVLNDSVNLRGRVMAAIMCWS